MSQIGSIASGNSPLYQFLLQAESTGGIVDPTSAAQSTTTPSSLVPTSDATNSSSPISALSDLRNQLETAVTNAVNNLGPSASPSDVLSAIGGAISQTLQANGINPQQLQAGQGHRHHHHGGGGSSSGTSSANSTSTNGDSTGGGSQTSTTSGDSTSSTNNGVDLISVFAQLFADFPNGSGVDVSG